MLPGIGIFISTGTVMQVLVPYLRAKGFKVDSVWAQTAEAARKAAEDLDIPFHTDRVDDVLLKKEVDLVFIMCAPILHAQIAVKVEQLDLISFIDLIFMHMPQKCSYK